MDRIKFRTFGFSELNQPIAGLEIRGESKPPKVLILGGVHGDETEGIHLTSLLLSALVNKDPKLDSLRLVNLIAIPCFNPDGALLRTRYNYNGVDLNRNLPTENWSGEIVNPRYPPGPSPSSEAETKVLSMTLEKFDPDIIVSLHSYTKSLLLVHSVQGKDRWTQAASHMAKKLNVPMNAQMEYSITGSLMSWAREKNSFAVTVEILRGLSNRDVEDIYFGPFLEFLTSVVNSHEP